MFRSTLFAGVVLVAGCAKSHVAADIAPVPFIDTNPDSAIVEVSLVAEEATIEYLPGKKAHVWAYRDAASGGVATVPGPLLEAKQGDLVIVHFRNDLPEPTTIHWHGVRVPANMDGSMPAQSPVLPGGTFEYRFHVENPGYFWYHPHVKSDVQIEKGLYGPILVNGGTAPDVARDRLFVLDDVKLSSNGDLSTIVDAQDLMLGHVGNVLLVNGRTDASIRVASGSRERWRFVNAANGRFFNLSLPGHTFTVIGWDGGLIPEPYTTATLLIAPGERYEVLVDLIDAPGTPLRLKTIYYDRGHNLPDPGPLDLLRVDVGGRSPAPQPLPSVWGTFVPLAVDASTPVKLFVLNETETPGQDPSFTINGYSWPNEPRIGALLDTTEIWEIRNDAEMDHPFHLHGTFFQVLERDGVPEPHLGWKDTVIVKQHETLRFAVHYDNIGHWMYHCHILEHAERGMMGELVVGVP